MAEKPRVLIVDDNSDYLFVMETFLSRNGFDTITAQDGKTGYELAVAEKPDIILLDIMMEGLFSGFQFCKKKLSDPELKDIPIIGISGIGDELGVNTEKYKFIKKYFNADNFFQKPVDKEKLLAKIKSLLTSD